MKSYHKTIDEIIGGEGCPLPIEIIPNNMGINLCSVDAISWQAQNDGQLTQLTIYFIPYDPNEKESDDDSQFEDDFESG